MPTPHDSLLAPEQTETDWSARRADARRNHERIVTAALQVFAEKGLEATVPDVAERAGVGKATVYRSYPTKADLITAVALHQLQWLHQRALAAVAEPDPYTALGSALADVFERLADDRVIAELLPTGTVPGADDTLQHTMELFGDLLEAGKATGQIRPDATVQDIRVLLGGCATQLTKLGDRTPATWHRYGRLILNALRV
jgi:AcrR family transcriptional regulator